MKFLNVFQLILLRQTHLQKLML